MRIVIADDEALLRLDLREILEAAGHMVVGEADNGVVALEMVEQLQPDLVILDVRMPGGDGLTAAKIIGIQQNIPVLLLTAYSSEDIVATANGAGVIGYLVKPVQAQQLMPAVEVARQRFLELQVARERASELEEELAKHKLITRAKGILMAEHGLTEDEAYARLQQYSMQHRMSLKSLAEKIITAQKNVKK